MEGVTFHIWNDDKSYDKRRKTDNGRITIDGVKDGIHLALPGNCNQRWIHVLDNAVKILQYPAEKVNGQSNP